MYHDCMRPDATCFTVSIWGGGAATNGASFILPSFVVGICVLGMISWNALQDTQPCNCHKITFFC